MQIRSKKYYSKGKRSIVYIGILNGKQVIIKKKNTNSKSKGSLKNEAKFLKILNKHRIGPKIISYKPNELVYIYIKGIPLKEYIKSHNKKQIISMIKQVLKIAYKLDKLMINKKEFHNLSKHVLIYNNKARLIDFERCYYTKKPKNVTQCCQYINKLRLWKNNQTSILRTYKKERTKINFNKILKNIS